ncbi:MAG: 7TM-DISM domain-containing protein, partial [Cyanobacteria bacterium P01_F01_bin.3]
REVTFRKPAFPVLRTIESSAVELFVFKIGAQGRLSFPTLTVSEKSFDEQRDLDHFFYGGIVAILLALGAYNATIFFSLRENVHFYYMFYIFAFGFLQIIASGLAQQYLWPERENLSSLNAHLHRLAQQPALHLSTSQLT